MPGGERAHRPVGALVLLVELHPEVLLEQRGEPDRRNAEELGGDTSVEQARDAPAVVLPQEAQIVVGVVKDDLDLQDPRGARRAAGADPPAADR